MSKWPKEVFENLFLVPTRNGIYKAAEFHGRGIKIVNMGELFANDRIGEQAMERVELTEQEKKVSLLQNGDLLFARRSLVESGAGKASIVTNVSEETTFESSVIRVRLDQKKCLPLFYLYWLRSYNGRSAIMPLVTGINVKGIRGSDLAKIEVDYPEIDTQKRITAALSVYEDLIENSKCQIKLLEEAVQRLYKEWFVDLRFPGHDDVEIVDGVPSGWERRKLKELASVLRRGISPTYNDEGEYTVINQKCIRSSIMSLDESRRQEKEYPDEINIRDADTVICSTGTGTLGRVGQVYGDYPKTTIDSHVTLVRAKRYENLLYHSIKANQEYLMGMGRGSTNQQELYRNVIEETEVLWPSAEIASWFESISKTIHQKIRVLNKMISDSIEGRDRLLPKLMSGEIEL